jgi:hypothetical protein
MLPLFYGQLLHATLICAHPMVPSIVAFLPMLNAQSNTTQSPFDYNVFSQKSITRERGIFEY